MAAYKAWFGPGLAALAAVLLGIILALWLVPEKPEAPAAYRVSAAEFDDLPGWRDGDHRAAMGAFRISCKGFARRPDDRKLTGKIAEAGVYGDWSAICAAAKAVDGTDNAAVRAFFEEQMRPVEVTTDDRALFTGYYEPQLNGSRTATETHQTPLLRLPDDLITVDARQFKDTLKGRRLVGRVEKNRLVPYYDRKEIDAGKLDTDKLALVYVDDPVDAFFLHIQGSGRVRLADGGVMRVGYAGQNGHRYYAIGKELLKRGHLQPGNVSMQSIRSWLAANPDQIQDILHTNPSYVFFRELKGPGPIGAFGLPLTPGRSLAVDRRIIPLGVPVWLVSETPKLSDPSKTEPLARLMLAQDTGGAIRGPVRGDIFFGHGGDAALQAGYMKYPGRWFLLLPKTVGGKTS